MTGFPSLRASPLRLTADQVRIGDLIAFAGGAPPVSFTEHRGGLVLLELDGTVRVTLPPRTPVVITRPRRRHRR
ncbi:hypothetical protein [Streptomyces lonarensis]|uniref:Uncharacterized protein n=1 Tax=Streptomyces lonarensis TaxID=700599 RepID=A0A7X6HZ00_9ACTN|nr:hypothetical protein [Streptomyces lonarensis]NJQ06116.1 hypothetical protein [Streptomyces lonarensis]